MTHLSEGPWQPVGPSDEVLTFFSEKRGLFRVSLTLVRPVRTNVRMANESKATERIEFRCTKAWLDHIDAAAKILGCTRTQLIIRATMHFLHERLALVELSNGTHRFVFNTKPVPMLTQHELAALVRAQPALTAIGEPGDPDAT